MNRQPIDLALRHVVETKHLVESLITSSESFDYRAAKSALKALEKKSRELGKLCADLDRVREVPLPPNVVPFPPQRRSAT